MCWPLGGAVLVLVGCTCWPAVGRGGVSVGRMYLLVGRWEGRC